MIPQTFSVALSSSEGTMRTALRASANFITRFSQLMFERISIRKVDLNPMLISPPT